MAAKLKQVHPRGMWECEGRRIERSLLSIIENFFLHLCNLRKNVKFSVWCTLIQNFSSLGTEINKILVSKKRDRFGVGAVLCRACRHAQGPNLPQVSFIARCWLRGAFIEVHTSSFKARSWLTLPYAWLFFSVELKRALLATYKPRAARLRSP